MARIKKKGTSGQAKNYTTRTQAIRKLQISLPDFRRLCIFKGIYPREPSNRKKANKSSTHSTTFYYTKDIQYLLHEPLLAKFREQKTLSKKIARSLGRNEYGDAARLEKHGTPRIKLDHIVRERYPTFIDALRDLDDALSLLFLFANLPSTTTVPPKVVSRCQRLCHEFEHYLIVSNALRKSFLSIKGIYYQATIQGQDIMWLVPYRFVQKVTGDIDYRIMSTFVEFYATLLGFVNYRLYTSIGLVYPPKFDTASDEKGAELAAFTLEGQKIGESVGNDTAPALTNGHAQTSNPEEIQKQIERAAAAQDAARDQDGEAFGEETQLAGQITESADAIDKFTPAAPSADTLDQPSLTDNQTASLFEPFTFYVSREAPRHPIELLLRAFGCKRVGWSEVLGEGAFTHNENDERITHQIVDRPHSILQSAANGDAADGDANNQALVQQPTRIPGRIYVQPQWVWDCVNEGKLLRPDLYSPGTTLPPHLSPWIKPIKGQYDPRATLAEQEEEGEAEFASEEEVDNDDGGRSKDAAEGEAIESEDDDLNGGMDVAPSEDEDESDDKSISEEVVDESFANFDSVSEDDAVPEAEKDDEQEEQEEEDEATLYQRELEAEAAGLPYTPNPTSKPSHTANPKTTTSSSKPLSKEAQQRKRQRKAEADELERRKMMMSRKKRKLYEKMQYGNEKRSEEAKGLRAKRRRIERREGGNGR
ncbi:MAG: hypothetical protein Q9227_007266 [Pyrenula ochraceoflavens]